ncbi:MAG: hypothetical protein ABSC17_01030 [Thermacetogeniaceae bacterium]
MGNLVDDMQSLSDDVIGSYINRKHSLDELKKEVNEMLTHFEAERLKMSDELQAKLAAFLLDLEKRVRILLKHFEEERAISQRELMRAKAVYAEMEAKMERLRQGCHLK